MPVFEPIEQSTPLPRGACFLFEPLRELPPLPDKAFMADIDDGAGFERLRMVGIELGGKEVAARRAECVDDGADVGLISVANLTSSPNRGRRTASVTVAPSIRARNTRSAIGRRSAPSDADLFACAFERAAEYPPILS